VICHRAFDFAAGETAVILKHVAYANDFVHEGVCLETALEMIFPEPGYDGAAFARDPRRARLLRTEAAQGWTAMLSGSPAPVLVWAVVEYRDGTRQIEGIVRDAEWADEPGGAQFAEEVRYAAA
jgi:hypothetical protein